jgi:hypothetical protein
MGDMSPGAVDFSQLASLRQVLDPQWAIKPSGQIRARMDAIYGEGAADAYDQYLEFSFSDIGKAISSAASDVGRFAAKAAPVVATVGGGALKGALSGAQFGLPGIIGGAALGGTGAALSKYGGGAARDIGGALSGVTGLAGQFSPLGRLGAGLGPAISGLAGGKGGLQGAAVNALSGVLGAAGGGAGPAGALGSLLGGGRVGGVPAALGGLLGAGGRGGLGGALGGLLGGGGGSGVAGALGGLLGGGGPAGPAGALASLFGGNSPISQLTSLLQRPEMARAFGALKLPPGLGAPTIPVGAAQTPVPTTAFPQLLAHLADAVVSEAAAWAPDTESEMTYMINQETGEYAGDPAFSRDRSAQVWALLNNAQAERLLVELAETAIGGGESAEVYAVEQAEAAYAAEQAEAEARDEAFNDAMEWAQAAALEAENEGYSGEGEYVEEYGL